MPLTTRPLRNNFSNNKQPKGTLSNDSMDYRVENEFMIFKLHILVLQKNSVFLLHSFPHRDAKIYVRPPMSSLEAYYIQQNKKKAKERGKRGN